MALRDYIHCDQCAKKMIYDGDNLIRTALEHAFGDPDADQWTVIALCNDHGGGVERIGPDAVRYLKER